MAYDNSNDITKELGKIETGNENRFIGVRQITNKISGAVALDVRWTKMKDGELILESKGIRFSSDLTLDIMEALASSLTATEVTKLKASLEKLEA